MSDVIFIREARFDCHLGVTPRERSSPQPVLLDVELSVDAAPAGTSDRIADTVNYTDVWKRIHECVIPQEYRLVEALATRVAEALLEGFPQVGEVFVRVTKPNALVARNVSAAGVEIRRNRVL